MAENLFLSPQEISKTLKKVGQTKANAPWRELLLAGILAGIYIGFGAVVSTVVQSGGTLDVGLARFLAGSVFSVGLMLVLIPGAELFTGNILMTIGFLDRRYSFQRILRNWLIVWVANFIGGLFLASLVFGSGLLTGSVGATAAKIAETKMALDPLQAFCRGILCNMLVCLAVIMSFSARTVTGKIFGIYFPIMVFVASGYEHSIANMYFLPAGLLATGQLFSRFWTTFANLIPVTLGNIVGGLAVVFLHPKNIAK